MRKSVIISILLLFIGLGITLTNHMDKKQTYEKEKQKIDVFFEKEINGIEPKSIIKNDYNYIAVLEIPKIKLEKGLVDILSIHNNVSENITILKESVMPDKEGAFILAAHSGTANISYFKHLNKLEINDLVYIYYDHNKYTYKINNFYEEEKGAITINNKSEETNVIVLTTCKPVTDDKQLVYVGHLIDKTSY